MSSLARKALIALAAAAGATAVLALTSLDGDDAYYVKAEFRDVGGLRKNSSVKVAGVPAGKVMNLAITRRDTAIATLRVDEGAAPIGRGASVAVRPTDLLGERYAEIDPGDRNAPLDSGALIPITRTSTPVELDDILNTLDPDTRTRLGILLNEFGIGLDGRGADVSKLLATLPPSLEETRKLIDQVSSQNAALKNLIVKGDRVTSAVGGRRDDMGDLIDTANGALTTVAQRRRELGATIDKAPAALVDLRTTLGRLDAAATQLRPAAADLERTAAPLQSTLTTLPAFADAAAPTLEKATAVAPQLTRLGKEATPAVRRLETTADLLQRALDPARPALEHLDRRGTDDLLYFANNVNRGLQGRDGIGHFISAKVYVNAEMISNAINAFNGYHPVNEKGDDGQASPQARSDGQAPEGKSPDTGIGTPPVGPIGPVEPPAVPALPGGAGSGDAGGDPPLIDYLLGP